MAVGKQGNWTFSESSNQPQGVRIYSLDTYLSSNYYVQGRYCIRPILQMRRLRLELGSPLRNDMAGI